MDMRLFEYALEIYKTKSFTKAASNLHIAQPSLSKQIAKLEQELGVYLFDRKPGSVEATPDGLCFVKQAEKILQMRDDLRREILERREGIRGELKIGSTAITGGHILPPLLQIYQEQYQNVCIKLVEESTERLIDLTARGLVDISLLSLPIEDSRLATKIMLTEPLYLVLPKKTKQWMPEKLKQILASTNLLEQYALPIEDFANCPFILLKQGYGFRRTVLELCARGKFEPQIAYETSSIETAQSLVGYGLGLTIVPEMIVHRSAQQSSLSYIKLDTNPTRTLVFTYNKERYLSMNAKALIEIYEKQS
ncbi:MULTISPECIES: LysR family transcriptional regulator [Metabacillus]|uniref:LysR family transcriptional regulator n=2 Tax=Metabacillus TaxID=2675233 RepID=A0A179T7Z4_9BACI|nr:MULTISPECIES: LysR family transcriptional regulator [Metabacillus]OAS89530.1 LysR family transcriptional regulator [Metabacillus litoralis]QNF29052.1 LysR family transcriptional regulator [Metabacillus sp. KUDC1714]